MPCKIVVGTKVPGNEKSWERKFLGTKGPGNESSQELSYARNETSRGVRINHTPAAPVSVWTWTGHTGRTSRILYTWPYWTPSKGTSNCPKC